MKSLYLVFLFILVLPLSFLNAGGNPVHQMNYAAESTLELPAEYQTKQQKRKAKRKKTQRPKRNKRIGAGWLIMLIFGLIFLIGGLVLIIAMAGDGWIGPTIAILGTVVAIVGAGLTTGAALGIHKSNAKERKLAKIEKQKAKTAIYDLAENEQVASDHNKMIHFVDGSEKSYKNLLRNYKKANLTPLKSVRQDLIQQYQALPNQSESRLERALEYRPHPSYRISDKYNLKILEDFFLDSNLEPNNLKQQEKLLFDRIKVLSYRISRIKQPKNK